MKKNTLVSLSLLFTLLLSLFACRKSIEFYVDGKEAPTTSLLESAKIWRSQRINTFDKKAILKPYWNDSWTVTNSDGKTLIIVPSPERRNSNKSISIRRFFVFTAKGGGITDGNIVEFVAEKSDVKSHLDDLLKNMTKDGISNFSGWISKYDINYQFLTSYVFHNGKKSNEQSKIVILNPGKSINSGPISVTFNSKGRISAARGSVSYGSGTVDCPLITPLITGEPVPMCAQALIIYRETWVADQDGCLISLVYTYFNHTCPSGLGTEGDGSGDGSGSASAEPDGSGTSEDGGNPEYGGAPTATYSLAEAEALIEELSNPVTRDGIELYLVASYKGSKLLNLSVFSTAGNQFTVGAYTMTPHYGSNGQLLFYSALRNADNGVEYIVKANQLSAFQNKLSYYTAAADLVYLGGVPTHAQIQMMSGDYLSGLFNMWGESLRNPYYYVYVANILITTTSGKSAEQAPSPSTPPGPNIPAKVQFERITLPNSSTPNYHITNMTYQQYKNALEAKFGPWLDVSNGNAQIINAGKYRYVARVQAAEWSAGFTIEIQYTASDKIMGKFRFSN